MPRNFDELLNDEDLTFTLGGETFTMQYVRPEVLASFEDSEDEETAAEALAKTDEFLLSFITPGDRDRFKALRERDDSPVTARQLRELVKWAVGVQTGRPTETPSPSATGPGTTAPGSPVRSRPRAAARRR